MTPEKEVVEKLKDIRTKAEALQGMVDKYLTSLKKYHEDNISGGVGLAESIRYNQIQESIKLTLNQIMFLGISGEPVSRFALPHKPMDITSAQIDDLIVRVKHGLEDLAGEGIIGDKIKSIEKLNNERKGWGNAALGALSDMKTAILRGFEELGLLLTSFKDLFKSKAELKTEKKQIKEKLIGGEFNLFKANLLTAFKENRGTAARLSDELDEAVKPEKGKKPRSK